MGKMRQELPVLTHFDVIIYGAVLALTLCGVTVSGARDARFPFLLSNGTCALPRHFTPMCTCTTRLNISDYNRFCGSYQELVYCLDMELVSDPLSLMAQLFNTTEVLGKMEYLCGLYKDIRRDMDTCGYEAKAKECDHRFASILLHRNNTFKKHEACQFVGYYSDCYWNTNCTGRVRQFLSDTAGFYSSYSCAKHVEPITDKCSKLAKVIFPESKKEYGHCVGIVNETRNCFLRENLPLSSHPVDVVHNIDFDIERYVQYRVFRCDIEKERDHGCSGSKREQQHVCFNTYRDEFKVQQDRAEKGSLVMADDICRIYDSVTQCMTTLFTDCPIEGVFFNSILCASMPTSCYCPVDLYTERIARASFAPPLGRSSFAMHLATPTLTSVAAMLTLAILTISIITSSF